MRTPTSALCSTLRFLILRRKLTSAADHGSSKFRNMALVAHIDSGKTTLTESILFSSSYISAAGTVDTGTTTTDFLPAERERGITIQSASIPIRWKQWTFNLIDTPGHADFGMEVESASRVVDGAVVLIDSVEGVEAQTNGVWRQLDRYQVATRMVFLNKLDRMGASFRFSLQSLLSHRLHPKPMVLTLPVASFDHRDYDRAEPGIQGLVDLVKWELWKWNKHGECTRTQLPREESELTKMSILSASHPLLPHLVPARTALLENLSMFSDDLMNILLDLPQGPSSNLSVDSSAILPHLRTCSLRNDILPVLCGSAVRHIGTELVMDYAGELLASPLDLKYDQQGRNPPVRLLAWKVVWDKRRGWMTFVRVYSGTLTKQTVLLNTNQNERERVSKLLLLYASQVEEVDSLPFGSVGVVLGLKSTRTGDTLVSTYKSASDRPSLPEIVPPPAVMSASITPHSHSDLNPVQDALQALTRTDPSVRVDMQDGQILIHGLGALHLEIVEGRLRDEWDVRFEVGRRRVSYRESLGDGDISAASDNYIQVIAGSSFPVTVKLKARKLQEDERGDPVWDGSVIMDPEGRPMRSLDSYDLGDPWGHIARGIASTLSVSPHTSLPLSRIHIEVLDFSYPATETSPTILTVASAAILRNILRKAGMGSLMEPYIRMKIHFPQDSFGRIVKDLTENGGEVLSLDSEANVTGDGVISFPEDGVYIPPEWMSPSGSTLSGSSPRTRQTLRALAPLSRMLDYSSRLKALSGGHGVFEMENAGFKEVSEERRREILQEIGKAT